ncbi:MAG TPA: MGMT family protein [Anaerolineales bacterium]|nr:MGMT family protein [Anaerolineales bacterium]
MSTEPPDATKFNLLVWDLVRTVPRGRVTTYGEVAITLGLPEGVDPEIYRAFGPRWVGTAMAVCPDDVPWQRVVNSEGRISIRKGSGHLEQRALLEAEGVCFDGADRIDLAVYGWDRPPAPRQGNLF